MKRIKLGKSGLLVSRVSFGCIPIQRISSNEAVSLLRQAYDSGVNFFDTARTYTDSEQKVGLAFSGMREDVLIATKTPAKNAGKFWEDLSESLRDLNTDYIDLYQLHNPPFLPMPGGEDGLYDAITEAKAKGMVRHIGITSHYQDIAIKAVLSGLYETLQYPFSCLASEDEEKIVKLCEEKGVGFIAMKAMAGGLIRNVAATFSYIASYPNAVPVWGIEKERELEEIIALESEPPPLDADMLAQIGKERNDLCGNFCRGCGYCMPCPVGIHISVAARIDKLITRSLSGLFTTPEWQEKMEKINECTMCGQCEEKCPYHLKAYELLKKQLESYRSFCGKV
jgi:predicted aldo/keto reductase-like oxidoreductase